MANKIIKYNLNADGTIPTYIADGGYYPKANRAAVKTYLDTYTSSWKDKNDAGEEVDFDQDAAATHIWTKKID